MDKIKRGDVKTYADLEDVLADPLVDVVDLVLPIPAMPSAIEKCLRAGKSVISEKPVAPSPEVFSRLWAQYHRSAADQSGKCCWCVVENWVAKPAVLHVHRLLQSHAIGVVEGYICRLSLAVPTLDQQGWRKQDRAKECELMCPVGEAGVAPNEREGHYEGGWGLDVGVHAIRAVRKWFGAVKSVTSVAADSKRGHAHPHTETSSWSEQMGGVLQHESGLQGRVHFDFFAPDVAGGVRGQQAMEATPEGHDVRHGVRVWGEKVCYFLFRKSIHLPIYLSLYPCLYLSI